VVDASDLAMTDELRRQILKDVTASAPNKDTSTEDETKLNALQEEQAAIVRKEKFVQLSGGLYLISHCLS
jgi:hypothetical protein